MAVSFTTSASGGKGGRMFAPLGAESMSNLAGFDEIKSEDLVVGMEHGAQPSVKRTAIDENTHTFMHGEDGVLAYLKKKPKVKLFIED